MGQSGDDEHRTEMLDIYEHHETQLVLVAETDGGQIDRILEASIRPFVEDCHSDHVGYLEGWFVEAEYRKNGIGREWLNRRNVGRKVKAVRKWLRIRKSETM
jgi:GNAT superfamily N-acetyltransferase